MTESVAATPALSVVIPNYRRPALLRACLRSVRNAQAASRQAVEIIVVDDGSGEDEPVEVFGPCGAAALYRRALLDELGGFDERFAFGLEDADVAWRARMRGWRCLYAPDAIVYHDLGGTVPHGSDLRLFQAG